MRLSEFKRSRAFLACASVAGLVVIVVAIAYSLPSNGQRIRGRPLLAWLQSLGATAGSTESSQAAEVIRSLDAKQMEGLAELLERGWSSSPDLSRRLNQGLDPVFRFVGLQGHLFAEGDPSTYCDLALRGIRELGTNAAPIVPRLVRDLKVWETSYSAASALSIIGGDAVLPVVAMLTNTASSSLPYRWPFACGLQAASPADAQIVVPALLQALEDPEAEVQIYATQGLKKFHGREQEFVPAMLRNLKNPISRVRGVTVETLGEIGWKEAIPQLKLLLSDPDPNLRAVVKVALRRLEH